MHMIFECHSTEYTRSYPNNLKIKFRIQLNGNTGFFLMLCHVYTNILYIYIYICKLHTLYTYITIATIIYRYTMLHICIITYGNGESKVCQIESYTHNVLGCLLRAETQLELIGTSVLQILRAH